MKKSTKPCTKCGEEIYFDPDKKSENDKFIPLDAITNEPHNCPNSRYIQKKSVGQEILDLEELEKERLKRISYE